MSRQDTDKDQGLTPAEEKKAQDAAKAAGRSVPNAHDTRDAALSHESKQDEPKRTGNPRPTGNRAAQKAHEGPKEH